MALLAQDQYIKLAGPVMVMFKGETGQVMYIVDNFTTQNVRVGGLISASVGGLVKARIQLPLFILVSDSSTSHWVSVGTDCRISASSFTRRISDMTHTARMISVLAT